LETYLARFAASSGDAVPAGVPARVFAFACQNVSPDVLRAIASAGRAGPVHFYFVSPVRGWWGDLRTVRERLRANEDDPTGDSPFDDGEHPLLRANGAAGRDFVRTLFAYDVVHPSFEQAVYAGPDPAKRTGLLHLLQRDLLERAPPRSAGLELNATDDASLQVHACHTRLREVQVLHDRLRDLLEADPTLQPRDIAVLAPDLAPYAPLIDAVFGGEPARQAIPYALADGLGLAARPVARTFAQLIALPQSRFGAEEILDLLAQPVLAERFDLVPADFIRLRGWLAAAGARWGLDGAHRASLGAPDDAAYTWSWALDRLLLGHASGSDDDLAGVAPLPWLEGGDLVVLDRALHGLRRLAHWQRALATPRPATEWAQALAALLDDLFPEHPREADDRATLELLRARVARLGEEASAAGVDAPVPGAVMRAWCADALGDESARAPLLTGGVTFARMVPMRWVPFKVICLLGMDDEAFPRREPPGGLNRLAAARDDGVRRVGDPSVRDDDRGLFLQLLGAATQALHVSYLGSDARTHEPRPPSVCVAELLDVAAAYFADPAAARAHLVVIQPLQPFAAAAFGGGAQPDARRRGYRGDWRAAAVAATGPRSPAAPFATTVPMRAVADADESWTGEQLLRVLANPAREFLQSRLGVALTGGDERLDEAEPFAMDDSLARWQREARAL
ncbi:MAG: exodeoxyribonuclease V subunit gamma, partial [Arenimonas sp.]